MASKDAWNNHLHPHVLTLDADPEEENSTIPLEEWDRKSEYEALVERIQSFQDRDRPYATVTDGGDVKTHNEFDCPRCEQQVNGKPEECPHCGAPYNW